jgi:protein-L-isoaspartate(D-aspartate) O-methyltransferase
MKQLIQKLIERGCLKDLNIIDAFATIDRADFVPLYLKEYAYENRPLPIGFGQTISQPEVVAFMLELLQPQQGEKILDVGFGSGWQTALLARIVGEKGLVVAIERIPELFDSGKKNCEKYGFKNIEFIPGDANIAYKKDEFFDKIIAAASSEREVPKAFKKQLKIGGIMVIPIRESIFILKKKDKNNFSEKEYPGFVFVPLVKE